MPPDDHLRFRGWLRPGPMPPGGVEPEEGETLDYLSGHFRIFQYRDGHRFSTDDVLTAWYGVTCATHVERVADLGSGIGSVAMVAAWKLPAARFVTVEAQAISSRLARKSIAYNGLADRFRVIDGDLRDASLFDGEAPFDLVLGSPPYFPPGTASEAAHPQAVPARIEVRGSVAGYAATASAILAPGGVFAFVFPTAQRERAEAAIRDASLTLVRSRDVVFRDGEGPMITLFAASRSEDLPPSFAAQWHAPAEAPLVIRRADGTMHPGYAAVRLSLGLPPGPLVPAL